MGDGDNIMNSERPVESWTTRAVRPSLRFNAWRDMINDTHLAWDIPSRRHDGFEGKIEQQHFGAVRIVSTECHPFSGHRVQPQISSADDEYIGILHVTRGRETITQRGREAILGPGDFCIWDSRQPMKFEIAADCPLKKLTVLLPRRLLRETLSDVDDHLTRVVSGASGSGALFVQHLHVLARESGRVPEAHMERILDTTLNLFATAVMQDQPISKGGKPRRRNASNMQQRLARAETYVARNLTDPDLTPARLAAAIEVSARQLHRTFKEAGLSVERLIWAERLNLCRQQLMNHANEPVSAVAFRCGFNDAAHFSRAFRQQFGQSPREFRKTVSGGAP